MDYITKLEKFFAFVNQNWHNASRTVSLLDCCVYVTQKRNIVVCP
jgi:hypothetical protein